MKDLCRICGKIPLNSDLKNLFNDNELVAFVKTITGMQIKNEEKIPANVCNVCDNRLKEMISFQTRCILVQNFFNFKIWKELKTQEVSKRITDSAPLTNGEDLKPENCKLQKESNVSNEEVVGICKNDDQMLTSGNSYLEEVRVLNNEVDEVDNDSNSIHDDEMEKAEIEKQNKPSDLHCIERKWICEICGRMFKSYSTLFQHRYTHNAVKAFKCRSCDKAYNFPYELKKHELTHTENHPFVCSFCSAKFSYASAKIRHEKIHTNKRVHKCSYCEKSFIERSKLRNHETTHTRIRKYHCGHCGYWALTQKQLQAHKKSQKHKRNEHEHNLRLQKNKLVESISVTC